MISDLDIHRSANVLIRKHGEDAALEAANLAEAIAPEVRDTVRGTAVKTRSSRWQGRIGGFMASRASRQRHLKC